nr:hypothetical protein Itr_chr14CG15870 [Ipomoea trifida]GMD93638.1 hypothetical protein Iba_chr14fCG9390 [Ipomoea batatas]
MKLYETFRETEEKQRPRTGKGSTANQRERCLVATTAMLSGSEVEAAKGRRSLMATVTVAAACCGADGGDLVRVLRLSLEESGQWRERED